jgi:hypothetical protein
MAGAEFEQVAHAHQALVGADDELRAAVVAARDARHTWGELGASVGRTKQWAHQKFGMGHQAAWRSGRRVPLEVRPVQAPDDVPVVQWFADAWARFETAERDLRDAVAAARAVRVEWRDIGAAVGITKQAAYERFGRRSCPSNL